MSLDRGGGRSQDGCLAYHLLQGTGYETTIAWFDRSRDEAAFDQHVLGESAGFLGQALEGPACSGDGDPEALEHIARARSGAPRGDASSGGAQRSSQAERAGRQFVDDQVRYGPRVAGVPISSTHWRSDAAIARFAALDDVAAQANTEPNRGSATPSRNGEGRGGQNVRTEMTTHSPSQQPSRPLLFISHRHADCQIADAVRRFVTDRSGGRIDVFQSSSAEADSNPRVGRELQRELKEHLWEASVVVLVYTSPEEDWSYCMWECGVATLESPETKVAVLQCGSQAPQVYADAVRVNARDEVSLQNFTSEFLTSLDPRDGLFQ